MLIHIFTRNGNYCYYEYPRGDFHEALKSGRLPDGLLQTFTAVLVDGGTKLYYGLDHVEETGTLSFDADGRPHAFCLLSNAHQMLPTPFNVAITMQSDKHGAWLMEGPGRFFLEEDLWEYRLEAVLLLFVRHLPTSESKRSRVAAIEGKLVDVLPDWKPLQDHWLSIVQPNVPGLQLVAHCLSVIVHHIAHLL